MTSWVYGFCDESFLAFKKAWQQGRGVGKSSLKARNVIYGFYSNNENQERKLFFNLYNYKILFAKQVEWKGFEK